MKNKGLIVFYFLLLTGSLYSSIVVTCRLILMKVKVCYACVHVTGTKYAPDPTRSGEGAPSHHAPLPPRRAKKSLKFVEIDLSENLVSLSSELQQLSSD